MSDTHESAATKRMKQYYQDTDFWCEFRYSPAYGLEHQPGVTRRDPTSVILVDGTYHIWYTRSTGPHFGYDSGDLNKATWNWDLADLWHATSPDGVHWTEQGPAVTRGEPGSYDDRSVYTAEILHHDNKFYLVYQVVQHPYLRASLESIAMASADSPYGPWTKTPEPILRPSFDPGWTPVDPDNPLLGESTGRFDDLRVHDPCLFFRDGKFWLYYKGEHIAEEWNLGGRDIRWGVAFADKPEGPYERSPYNPISNTGHETLLWPHKGGMVGLLTLDGPEANTIQYAPDGINFEIKAYIRNPPIAAGPFRNVDFDASPLAGLSWGMCHVANNDGFGNIMRFDTARDRVVQRKAQRIPF
ncbi:MAG: family 43 glycosylhydrolase [Planctomycetota bacterium]